MTPEPARPRGPAPAEPDKPRNVTRRGPESVEVLLELDPALSIDERRRICREHDIVMIELPAPDGKPTYVYQSDSVSMTPAAIEKLRATPGVRAVQTRVVPEEQR